MSDDPRTPLPDLTSGPSLDTDAELDATRVHSAPTELLDAMRRHEGAAPGPSETVLVDADSLPSFEVDLDDLDELAENEPTYAPPPSAAPQVHGLAGAAPAPEVRTVRLVVALAVALLSAAFTVGLLRYLDR